MNDGTVWKKGVLALVLLVLSVPGIVLGVLWGVLACGFAAGMTFVDWVSKPGNDGDAES